MFLLVEVFPPTVELMMLPLLPEKAELNELRNINIPKINHYISGGEAMRSLRNEDETRAWGYLQAIGYVNSKKKQQQADASSIEDFNWADLGYEL